MNTNKQLFNQERVNLESRLLEELNCCIPNLNKGIKLDLWNGTSIKLYRGTININDKLNITTILDKENILTMEQDIEFTEMKLQILKNWEMIKSLFLVYDKKYEDLRNMYL